MKSGKTKPTEEIILNAAMKVFTRRGYAGARTEDIAKEAGINRALLHYYYRDKETIFNLIFETRIKEFFGGVFGIFQTTLPLFEKIDKLVQHEIETFSKHPDLAHFVLGEIAQEPERLLHFGEKLNLNPRKLIAGFENQINEEVKRGTLRPVDGRQLIIHIMSLCIYPFIARPIIKTMMQMEEPDFMIMMDKRKKEVYEFIMHAIKK